jgi:hypothetical protein
MTGVGESKQLDIFMHGLLTLKAIPCKGGERMDFEVAGTRPDPVYFDWYGT